MAEYEGIKTLNGCAYPDMDLTDDRCHYMKGGGGNQGTNAIGLPYATAAIGSGPVIDETKDDTGVREGASFGRMSDANRNKVDRNQDYERDYKRDRTSRR